MERTSELNGAEVKLGPTDPKTRFCLTDPTTGARVLIREMNDAQLATFLAGVAYLSQTKLKAVLTRLQLLMNPLDANMLISMFEQALTNAALRMVLEYEQNRRVNLAAAELPA